MNNKIGVAVITCNRPDFFAKCIETIPSVDEVIVVNDGKKYKEYPAGVDEIIQNPRNLGVAASKNIALRRLIELDCAHLFLVEDDIIIKNPHILEKYIKTAATSGIWHLNYGLHGSYNRRQDGTPIVKMTAEYTGGTEVALYHNILGAFSYYFHNVIRHVGYMDERFHNAFEHVEHTYRIILKGLHPQFWHFADVINSQDDIEDQTENYEGSTIRQDEKKWKDDLIRAMSWFKHKHGEIPQKLPQAPEAEVQKTLETLEANYARPIEL